MTYFTLRFQNQSGETVPGFAVMFVTELVRGASNQVVFQIIKPELPPSILGEKLVLINSAQPIADGEYGWARYAETVGPVLYASGTPVFGTMWGVANDSWSLVEDAPGFEMLGLNDTTNTLTYARLLDEQKYYGVATSTISPASNGKTGATTGSATLWIVDSGSNLADGPSVTVTNRSLDSTITSGTHIQVQWSWQYLEWMIVWADC